MLVSLFSGSGGLDVGFEQAGFEIGLALDSHRASIDSYNFNRPQPEPGHVVDISELTIAKLNKLYGSTFTPSGVIGGPPCQGFSKSNTKNGKRP